MSNWFTRPMDELPDETLAAAARIVKHAKNAGSFVAVLSDATQTDLDALIQLMERRAIRVRVDGDEVEVWGVTR